MSMPQIASAKVTPLAHLLRPTSLDEVVGQSHLIGPGRPLRSMVTSGKITSSIVWGQPGTGKTTIIRAMANDAAANFVNLNATASGAADIKRVLKEAGIALMANKQTIVFIDEIHRFNKAQQDVLLPGVEDGTIVLFGATTEKPKFAVNPTILSRTMSYELKPLTLKDLAQLFVRAKQHYSRKGRNLQFEQEAARLIMIRSSGDARKMLTAIETVVEVLSPDDDHIVVEHVNVAFPEKHLVFDASGNEHFDYAHAYQEAVQHSLPDDAVYWLAKWVASGEDPAYICRRMEVMAWEDAGGNPMAPLLAQAAVHATERTGLPECLLPMAYATIEIAMSERNKVPYKAIKAAMADVERGVTVHVPEHLRAGTSGYPASAINRRYVNGWRRDAPAFERREE